MMAEHQEETRCLVSVDAGDVRLEGELTLPSTATGVVVFVHGSGSSRLSPRNRAVAQGLVQAGLATLLFDLLSAEEERIDQRTRHLRFDIGLLAARTVAATDWLLAENAGRLRKVGYFGASTGAAAALIAAAQRPKSTRAVVSRGGRPDLAAGALQSVAAPTLLIVGGRDLEVLALNRTALAALPPTLVKSLVVVPGATHLFAEPGALEEVTRRTRDWFVAHLAT